MADMLGLLPKDSSFRTFYVSDTELNIIADWLIDDGRVGDAALVRASWRADTWFIRRTSNGKITVEFTNRSRFIASCAFVADPCLSVFIVRGFSSFMLNHDEDTKEVVIHYMPNNNYGDSIRLDTELVVSTYMKLVEHANGAWSIRKRGGE